MAGGFIPKAEALRRMRKRHPDPVPMLPSNPLPDALVVRPVKGVEQRRIATIVRDVQGGVERVKLTPAALRRRLTVSPGRLATA
jgi:cell division protein FtsX